MVARRSSLNTLDSPSINSCRARTSAAPNAGMPPPSGREQMGCSTGVIINNCPGESAVSPRFGDSARARDDLAEMNLLRAQQCIEAGHPLGTEGSQVRWQ